MSNAELTDDSTKMLRDVLESLQDAIMKHVWKVPKCALPYHTIREGGSKAGHVDYSNLTTSS
jgi:hypothetical protein